VPHNGVGVSVGTGVEVGTGVDVGSGMSVGKGVVVGRELAAVEAGEGAHPLIKKAKNINARKTDCIDFFMILFLLLL
jgi:DUF1009 family protein